jgi:molecular chaperone IbpA
MNQVARIDTAALSNLSRALVGFDTLFDNFEKRFANQVTTNYPPYNVLRYDENSYEIQMAVTGFAPDEISVELDQNELIIKGKKVDSENDDIVYIHHGLASRDFTRVFTMTDQYMEVGDVKIKHGVLTISIKRIVPDSLKPRTLKIIAE